MTVKALCVEEQKGGALHLGPGPLVLCFGFVNLWEVRFVEFTRFGFHRK